MRGLVTGGGKIELYIVFNFALIYLMKSLCEGLW
nr:MAG TPA: hypothetical protein [Caudoviricetes sp.]